MAIPPNQPPRPSDKTPHPHASQPPPQPPPTLPESSPGPPPPPNLDAAPARSYLAGIFAAGLAALCGALVTSWAGVQGTLIGAMVGATIGSGVAEVVRAPLDALERRIIQAGVSARRLRRDGLLTTVLTSPTAAQEAVRFLGSRGAIVTMTAIAIAGFALAISSITAVEAVAGEPLAAMIADAPETGTTIGNALPAPPVLLPGPSAPGGPPADRGGGRVTSSRPADPILGSEDPRIAASPSAAASGTAANEAANANSAASPEVLASPDTITRATTSAAPGTTTSTSTATATPSRTPTPTSTPTSTPASSGPTT